MNRKKIYKILSSTISGLYLINTTSVFAQEATNIVSIEANADIDISQTELNEEQDNNNLNKDLNEELNEDSFENLEEDKTNNSSETNKEENSDILSDNRELEDTIDNREEAEEVVSVEDDSSIIEENKNKDTEKLNNLITSDDNLKKVTTKIAPSSQTIHKPTINYLDGYIELEDNGISLDNSNIENFDSSENLKFNFSNSEWTISGGNMVSKTIGHSSSTKNSITLELEHESTITIKAKVSSEKNYDWGKIYINGQEVFKQSGTTNTSYTTVTQKLSSGTNTIEFEYSKDSSSSSGLDAMFIDEIRVESSVVIPNSEKLEYRLNGGSWSEYTESFPCEEGDLIEARAYYNLSYSDIETIRLDIVNIVDNNLKKELNAILGKDIDNDLILKSDLESLTTLNISNKDISDLSGLENAINLTTLNISNNKIADISVVEKMTKLESIVAKNNEIENINSILNIESLVSVDFESNNINNIEAIENLPNLASINFKKNNITNEKDVNIISNKDSLKSINISLNIPNLVLNIGEGNSFNNVVDLYLDYSTIGTINVSNANNLRTINAVYSEVENFNLSNCNLVNTINLNYSEVDNIDVHDVSSYLYLTMSDGIVNTLTIRDCTYFSNVSIQGSKMESLVLENLSSKDSITLNLDRLSSRKIKISNITTQSQYGNYLNSSYVKSEDVTFENVFFGSMNMDYSIFNNFYTNNISSDNIYLWNFETNSDLDFSNANIRHFSAMNIKAKNLTLISLENLDYIALNDAVLENITIEDCPKLSSGVYLNKSKTKDVYINNLDNIKTIVVDGMSNENLVVENCPNLTVLSNKNRQDKGIIRNLTLRNLDNISELNFDDFDIESIDISDCNSITNINLSNNNIKDISQIESLNALTNLNINNNNITDISPLKNIASLDINNVEALDQTIELSDITVKEGTIEVDSPSIIDYDGNFVAATEILDKAKIGSNKVNLGEYTEGVYDKVIKFESATSKYSVNVSQKINVDGTAPELNITPNVNEWTNKNISLNIVAHDEFSGINYIKLPNGDIVKDSTCKIEVEFNGLYEFEAVDMVGNSVKKSITVSNIDKENPVIQASVIYNDDNSEAIIQIGATDNLSGILNIVLPNGEIVQDVATSYVVTKNGNYSIAATDIAGNIHIQLIEVDEIQDKSSLDDDKDSNDNNNENNLDKIPNASGLGVFAPIVTLMSLAIGLVSLKKRK